MAATTEADGAIPTVDIDRQFGLSDDVPSTSEGAVAMLEEIRAHDLVENVVELQLLGYTVVPPAKLLRHHRPGFNDELRERLLDVVERRRGVRIDPLLGTHDGRPAPAFGEIQSWLLFEDRIFEEVVLNPVMLTLASYLVGKHAILSSVTALLKAAGHDDLSLHSDIVRAPPPYSVHPSLCNMMWLLTDFDRDNGSTAFVAGSHHHCRFPLPGEAVDERVPVVAPAGSLVVWSGNTWHGAFARKRPGYRISLTIPFFRPFMRPAEYYREHCPDAVLKRNPPRFATLLGKGIDYGWGPEGPDPTIDGVAAYAMGRHPYD